MSTLAQEIARAEKQGDVQVANFSGAVRSIENLNIELNDEWTFPENFKVYRQKIGTNFAEYIFIEVNGNAKKFYPSTFTKRRVVYNEDGTSTGMSKHTLGTAAEQFRTATDVAEGMAGLAGKKVKVTKMEKIRTLRYGTDQLMDTFIPTIDIVQG